jgi:hypothetical protein
MSQYKQYNKNFRVIAFPPIPQEPPTHHQTPTIRENALDQPSVMVAKSGHTDPPPQKKNSDDTKQMLKDGWKNCRKKVVNSLHEGLSVLKLDEYFLAINMHEIINFHASELIRQVCRCY